MDDLSRFRGYGQRLGGAAESNSMLPLPYRSRKDRKDASTSQPSILPPRISDDIEQLQKFIQQVWDTTCYKCNANITSDIDVKDTITQWFNNSTSERSESSISTRRCGNCHAVTCLGCGETARKGRPHKINDHYMSWCCLDGRILTVWMMLCRFDKIELELRTSNKQPKQPTRSRISGNTSSGVSGVGYTAHANDPWWMMFGGARIPGNDMPVMRLKEEDPGLEGFISWIMDMVAFTLPGSKAEDLPAVLLAMLQLSLVIDKAAELLRNDSLDDIMNRSTVYYSVLNLVEKIGAHEMLLGLVQDGRFSKTWSSGLESISFPVDSNRATKARQQPLILAENGKDQSLAKRLENLAIQSKLVLALTDSDPDLRRMCQQISSIHKSIMKNEGPDSHTKPPEDQWSNFHKAYSLTYDDVILDNFLHELRVEAGQIERQLQFSRTTTDRNKRIMSECANMRTSLDEGTFVVVAECRPDMMSALIVGPEDTPYANGLFE